MTQPEPRLTPGQMVMRLLGLAAIVAGIVAAGIAIYRNQKQSAGMPVAAAPMRVPCQATAISRTWPLKSPISSGIVSGLNVSWS